MAPLKDEHSHAGTRQVCGVGQSVMAAADHNRIIGASHVDRLQSVSSILWLRVESPKIVPLRVCSALLADTAAIIRSRIVPIGTAFHERTFALCESLSYREWSGYYAVSSYETHHEHEYNAIRNAAALIDITPLYKYRLTGKDATRLVDRIITRDMRKVSVGTGHLHALVRRARQGDRRWHPRTAGREHLSLDCSRSEPALVSPERDRDGSGDR